MNTTLAPLLHHLRCLTAPHTPDADAALLDRFTRRRDEAAFSEIMAWTKALAKSTSRNGCTPIEEQVHDRQQAIDRGRCF
jgi:hypothetical protein